MTYIFIMIFLLFVVLVVFFFFSSSFDSKSSYLTGTHKRTKAQKIFDDLSFSKISLESYHEQALQFCKTNPPGTLLQYENSMFMYLGLKNEEIILLQIKNNEKIIIPCAALTVYFNEKRIKIIEA